MKKGELNKLIRERTQVIVAKLPVQLNRKQTNLIETAVKEVVLSVAEDIQKADLIPQEAKDAQEKLQRIQSLWSEINKELL